jgi:hypothetical protein
VYVNIYVLYTYLNDVYVYRIYIYIYIYVYEIHTHNFNRFLNNSLSPSRNSLFLGTTLQRIKYALYLRSKFYWEFSK